MFLSQLAKSLTRDWPGESFQCQVRRRVRAPVPRHFILYTHTVGIEHDHETEKRVL